MNLGVEVATHFGRYFLDVLGAEELIELLVNHLHAHEEHGTFFLGCGLHTHVKIIKHRQ